MVESVYLNWVCIVPSWASVHTCFLRKSLESQNNRWSFCQWEMFTIETFIYKFWHRLKAKIHLKKSIAVICCVTDLLALSLIFWKILRVTYDPYKKMINCASYTVFCSKFSQSWDFYGSVFILSPAQVTTFYSFIFSTLSKTKQVNKILLPSSKYEPNFSLGIPWVSCEI